MPYEKSLMEAIHHQARAVNIGKNTKSKYLKEDIEISKKVEKDGTK